LKYAVTVEYTLERVITVSGRTGKEAATEALRIVGAWKDVQSPKVVFIELAVRDTPQGETK
jgi:hypothetical protein